MGMMRRLCAAALALLAGGGCAITDRLDTTNEQLAVLRGQLGEANQRLGDTQTKLAEANQQLRVMDGRLAETNQRLGVVDQAIQKLLPGLPAVPAPRP